MKTKRLELDVYRLLELVKLLPNPSTFIKDKFVIAISDTDSFSEVTFLKVNNKWKLLMDSIVEKTQKLTGREFNAVWIDEVINQNEAQLNQLCQRVRPIITHNGIITRRDGLGANVSRTDMTYLREMPLEYRHTPDLTGNESYGFVLFKSTT
jgi:hypothetical protein